MVFPDQGSVADDICCQRHLRHHMEECQGELPSTRGANVQQTSAAAPGETPTSGTDGMTEVTLLLGLPYRKAYESIGKTYEDGGLVGVYPLVNIQKKHTKNIQKTMERSTMFNGQITKNYGKSPCSMEKSPINGNFP